jgi:hypothetical protein
MFWLFPTDANLKQLATDPVTGEQITVSRNGVRTACRWFLWGIPGMPADAEVDVQL